MTKESGEKRIKPFKDKAFMGRPGGRDPSEAHARSRTMKSWSSTRSGECPGAQGYKGRK
jgi:hypothetical protein